MSNATSPEKFKEMYEKIALVSCSYSEKLDLLQQLQNFEGKEMLLSSNSVQDFVFSMVVCLSCPTSTVRTAALRTTRLYCNSVDIMKELLLQNAHFFITMSFERFKETQIERIQALKMMETFLHIESTLFPRIFCQSIVAVAKLKEDPFCNYCLELLALQALKNPACVHLSDGIEVLMHSVLDFKPFKPVFQDAIISVIIYLLSKPSTRGYIDHGSLRILCEPYTNTFLETPKEVKLERRNNAQSGITSLLRGWPGLICFISDFACLNFLVQSLQLPDLDLVLNLLVLFFKIFRLPIPSQKDPFERKVTYTDGDSDSLNSTVSSKKVTKKRNILNNYLVVLIIACNEAKLLENLVVLCNKMSTHVISDDINICKTITIHATCLIGDLMYLSNHLLPTSMCVTIQSLPLLVNTAIQFDVDPRIRSSSSTTVSNLEKYSMHKQSNVTGKGTQLDYFGEVKKNIDLNMDEATLRQKLNDSQVLLKKEKDFQLWRWDIIQELIEGPLYNPDNYESPSVQKFIQKLLSFLLPANKIFCAIPYNATTKNTYVYTSSQLLKLILTFPSGQQMLSQHKLIPQICELLKDELVPGPKTPERPLSRDQLLRNTTVAYFHFIGLLSALESGRALLQQYRVFDILMPLSNLNGRDDLSNVIIKSLEYNSPECLSRMLLGSLLKSKSLVVRFLAMRQMGTLYKKGINDFSDWCIILLVQQLADGDKKIANTALNMLNDCAEDNACLQSIISQKPYNVLSSLDNGNSLLLKMLSLTTGFKYLSTTPFIEEQMKLWKDNSFYIDYVSTLDKNLEAVFSSPVWRREGQEDTEVCIPAHFYGELAHTQDGVKLLSQSGVFRFLIDTLVSEKSKEIEKRGALWALGNIGKSRTGFKTLIAKEGILPLVLELTQCPWLALRGTAFIVLGLIGRNRSGAKALESFGWSSLRELGIAVPKDGGLNPFFHINPWPKISGWPSTTSAIEPEDFSDNELTKEAIKHFIMLSNNIKSEAALGALKLMKKNTPEIFNDVKLQYQCFKILEFYSFKAPARRICHQIFSTHWKPDDINSLPKSEIDPITSMTDSSYTFDNRFSVPIQTKKNRKSKKL